MLWIGQLLVANPSENQSGNKNSVAERVGPTATRTDKRPYFKYNIMMRYCIAVPNSPKEVELWGYHPRRATTNPHCPLSSSLEASSICLNPQRSCLVSPCL
ncbi:hypothetical protein TNCV_1951721 [Trichonephila clavipes]|nr:hypothetical protein TNCV_1951721 [Trichonephila clavipes]